MMAGIAKVWLILPRNSNWQKCVYPSLKPLVFSTTFRSLSVVPDGVDRLTNFVVRSKKLFVLTGAGVSTESGIPDYMSEKTGFRDNKEFRDRLLMKKFKECAKYRQDHWLDSYLIWEKYSRMGPNDAHKVLKHLENIGRIYWLVTTNVDGFHKMAGSEKVTELHGSARRVVCLTHDCPDSDCRKGIDREEMQKRIKQMNEWLPNLNSNQRLNELRQREEYQKELKVPACKACNGILGPGFVFKDEEIRDLQKYEAETKLKDSDAMLVVGTSLQGKSGYSLVKQAEQQGKPIAIINIGRTNAERPKIDAPCQDVFVRLQQNIPSGLSKAD